MVYCKPFFEPPVLGADIRAVLCRERHVGMK